MITLSKSGNTVTFTFDENSGYLQNGTIDVPINSLALITDESDMATFRKSASNDIFISARYEEFGMSKAQLEQWYKANMVSSGGGGGGTGGTTPEEVQQMIDSSISGKTDTSAFTAFSGDVQSTLDEIETVAGAAFNDLNDRMAEKLDASAYTPVDLSDYYTTAQTDSAITASVSGKADTSAVTQSISEAVSGKASQSDLETVSGQVANKQDTLVSGTNIKTVNNISLLGSGNIDIQGGGGSGGCTVDETVVYNTLTNNLFDYNGDYKYEYAVIDFQGDKTSAITTIYFIAGDASNDYAQGNITFDYPNHSASTDNTAMTEYFTIEYINDINDFKVSVASAYQSTCWIKSIQNFFNTDIKVEFYVINSGSPCTAIETDVVGLVEKVKGVADKSIWNAGISGEQYKINLTTSSNDGGSNLTVLNLDELDATNSVLKPDIKIGLGTSGWTDVSFTQGQCQINKPNSLMFRITYANDFDPEHQIFDIQTAFFYGNNMTYDMVQYDVQNQTAYGSITGITTAATYEWSASTKELVITYPATVEYGGETVDVRINQVGCGCSLGYKIIKFETYGELKQDLKPYVQETREALGGLSLVKLTQAQYDALAPDYDANTLYIIKD